MPQELHQARRVLEGQITWLAAKRRAEADLSGLRGVLLLLLPGVALPLLLLRFAAHPAVRRREENWRRCATRRERRAGDAPARCRAESLEGK